MPKRGGTIHPGPNLPQCPHEDWSYEEREAWKAGYYAALLSARSETRENAAPQADTEAKGSVGSGSPADAATVEVFRSGDGRVFANVNQGGRQLAHLKAGESYTFARSAAAASETKLTPLSDENRASRMPLPPEVLAGALQDKIETGPERTRSAPSVRSAARFSLRHLQQHLPWTIPYSAEFEASAGKNGLRRVGHDVLHVMKSLGRIAAEVEAADHDRPRNLTGDSLAKEAADLVICALHIARMEGFDLHDAVVNNSEARNAASIPPESSAASSEGATTPETPGSWEQRCAVLYQVIGALASAAGIFETSDDVSNALDVAVGRGDVENLLPWPKDVKMMQDLEKRCAAPAARRTPACYGIVNAAGKMWMSESCIVEEDHGELSGELEQAQEKDKTYRVVPLFAESATRSTCQKCGASWDAPVQACPVCEDRQ